MGTDVIPFGKYRGHSVDEIAKRDPQYLQWLTGQAWFAERFQPVYQLVVNNFAPVSEETPAHNSMQVRFLDFDYRVAFVQALQIDDDVRKRLQKWAERDAYPDREAPIKRTFYAPEFETWTDVVFAVRWQLGERLDIDAMRWIAVEIKPSMGDDFPAVLRQIKRQRGRHVADDVCTALLVGEYSGMGATLDQVRQVFANDAITIVLEGEVRDALIWGKQHDMDD